MTGRGWDVAMLKITGKSAAARLTIRVSGVSLACAAPALDRPASSFWRSAPAASLAFDLIGRAAACAMLAIVGACTVGPDFVGAFRPRCPKLARVAQQVAQDGGSGVSRLVARFPRSHPRPADRDRLCAKSHPVERWHQGAPGLRAAGYFDWRVRPQKQQAIGAVNYNLLN